MINAVKFVLLISIAFCNDGEGPLFTNIIPTSDFFYNNSIQIDTQANDEDGISNIILYYRFSPSENYKNITMDYDLNYSITIPGFEVISEQIEYYFLGTDLFGNQRKFPEGGDEKPFNLPILKDSNNTNDYELNLVSPNNSTDSDNISIIILSLYSEEETDLKNNIEIILNNQNITQDCNVSNDLITYVPSKRLDYGNYELILKIINKNSEFVKKIYFESLKPKGIEKTNNLYDWLKKINYSGNINYSSDYDKVDYKNIDIIQSNTQPLDIHRINFNLKIKYKKINLKTSALFNTHIIDDNARFNKQYKQPMDRIKIGLQSPYINLNFGDYSTVFTDLTLKGSRVRGYHGLIEFGVFNLTYIRGKTRELIQAKHWEQQNINNSNAPGFWLNDSTVFLYYNKGTPSRNLRALRTELNFPGKVKFGLTGLSSYDVQDIDIPYSELYSNYLFIGNALLSSDLTLFLNNKRTWLSLETAISMTNNILDDNLNQYITNLSKEQSSALGALKNIIGFPITTDLLLGKDQGRGLSIPNPPLDDKLNVTINSNYLQNIIKKGTYKIKFKSPFVLFNIPFNINGEYKRIPYSYVSFGNPSIPKDIQGLSTTLKMNLLNNRMIINLGYNNDNDNLSKYKLSTTNSKGTNIGINLNFDKIPSLSYSTKILYRNDDGGIINNETITHTIAPSYKFSINNIKIGFNNNFMIMNYYDNLLKTGNNNFKQLSISNSLSLSTKRITVNSGLGISTNKPEDINKNETKFSALSSKISYKPENNKFNYYIGYSKVSGKSNNVDNGINNQKNSFKIGSQYKFNQYSSIIYNFQYLIFEDNIDSNNNYSEFKGKLNLKITF